MCDVEQPADFALTIADTDLAPFDAVCGIGGDGTFHHLVNAMRRRPEQARRPLGLIPAGTGNALMRDLDCTDPTEAARRIVSGSRRRIDLLRVEHDGEVTWCFNIIGWGLVCSINRLAESWRRFGRHRYTAATVARMLRPDTCPATITFDDERLEGPWRTVIACNTRYTGRNYRMAPDARLDDGLVDLVLVRPLPTWKLLRLFSKVRRGKPFTSPQVMHRQVRSFRLADSDGPLNLDGELRGRAPIDVTVVPNALELVV